MAIVHFVDYKKGTQSHAAMRGVMLYVMQEKKTTWEGEPLVSGINCQPQSVYDDFLNTKLLYHKDGGVMFYHMVQSLSLIHISQCFPGPVSGREGLLLVHIVPRQDDAQHIVQQIQQQ